MVDGDTIEVRGERIRIWGIDAPEGGQSCRLGERLWYVGPESAAALQGIIDRAKDFRCENIAAPGYASVDRFGRSVSRCYADGADVGGELVRQGWAYDWQIYSRGHYWRQEREAEKAGRGMWRAGAQCIAPSEWRRGKR